MQQPTEVYEPFEMFVVKSTFPERSDVLIMRQELEYLCDLSVISPQQMQSILAQLPAQTPIHSTIQSPTNIVSTTPIEHFNIPSVKQQEYSPAPSPAPLPPPAYPTVPTILSIATALYLYKPTDAGDLALQQNDRIQVIEHMNNDCRSNPWVKLYLSVALLCRKDG